MKKFKILRNIFIVVALVLSHVMCAETAFNYASFLCAVEHMGFSAPANIAFIFAIPYGIGIAVCVILVIVFNREYIKRAKKDLVCK